MSSNQFDKLNKEILDELNKLRKDPKSYIKELETVKTYFHKNEYRNPESDFNILSEEGVKAVEECISVLKNTKNLPKIELDKNLCKTVEILIKDIGPSGKSSSEKEEIKLDNRLKKNFSNEGEMGENLSFGCKSGKEVILQMLIDDGVQSRAHRNNLLNSNYTKIGIFSEQHKIYNICSGLILFGEVKNKDEIFDRFEIPKTEWPQDCLSLQKFVEVKSTGGIKNIKVKYCFKMEEGEDVIVEKEFTENV